LLYPADVVSGDENRYPRKIHLFTNFKKCCSCLAGDMSM
jgi:hypothetical protein